MKLAFFPMTAYVHFGDSASDPCKGASQMGKSLFHASLQVNSVLTLLAQTIWKRRRE